VLAATSASTRRRASSPVTGTGGLRRLVISSDFYTVYSSTGKKADGPVSLFCYAHEAYGHDLQEPAKKTLATLNREWDALSGFPS